MLTIKKIGCLYCVCCGDKVLFKSMKRHNAEQYVYNSWGEKC